MLQFRRAVLAIIALVFAGIAIASAAVPHTMAQPLGYALANPNALNEFRAIYVGLWLAHTFIFGWAARRVEVVVLGDVCALLLAGQVVGRLLSLALGDPFPDAAIAPSAIAELIGAGVLAATRPKSSISLDLKASAPSEQRPTMR